MNRGGYILLTALLIWFIRGGVSYIVKAVKHAGEIERFQKKELEKKYRGLSL